MYWAVFAAIFLAALLAIAHLWRSDTLAQQKIEEDIESKKNQYAKSKSYRLSLTKYILIIPENNVILLYDRNKCSKELTPKKLDINYLLSFNIRYRQYPKYPGAERRFHSVVIDVNANNDDEEDEHYYIEIKDFSFTIRQKKQSVVFNMKSIVELEDMVREIEMIIDEIRMNNLWGV